MGKKLRIPATGWAYIICGFISFSRAYTWINTSWGDSPHVGFLTLLPNGLVAILWVISGLAMCVSWWYVKARYLAVPLTACMNGTVGVASFFNRAFMDGTGVTFSVAVSYIGIAIFVVLLPLMTDKRSVLDGGGHA